MWSSRIVLALGVALATTGLASGAIGASRSPRRTTGALCSLFSLPAARGTSQTYFVGVALRDTVFAGLGDVQPTAHEGHWGSGEKRAVYGQLVRIDTLGGAHVDLVRQTLTRRRSRDVVVVPGTMIMAASLRIGAEAPAGLGPLAWASTR